MRGISICLSVHTNLCLSILDSPCSPVDKQQTVVASFALFVSLFLISLSNQRQNSSSHGHQFDHLFNPFPVEFFLTESLSGLASSEPPSKGVRKRQGLLESIGKLFCSGGMEPCRFVSRSSFHVF